MGQRRTGLPASWSSRSVAEHGSHQTSQAPFRSSCLIGIEGNGVDNDGQVVSPGSKSTVTVTLKPGKYEFCCPVPSHKAAGMTGTLIVS